MVIGFNQGDLICFSFIVSFLFSSASPENNSKKVQEFFWAMEAAIIEHPLRAGAPDDEFDSSMNPLQFLCICFTWNGILIVLVQRYDRKHGLGLGRKEVVGYGMHKFPLKEIELFEPEVDGNWEEKVLP